MPPKSNQPSNLELQVLSVLWENGASTVRDVLAALPDGKTRAYTTVLTVMQNMEKKGLLTRSKEGSAHVYAPAESQRQTLKPMMQNLLRNVFGGRVSTVMQHFLEETEVSEDEITEIRRLIDQRKNANSE